ncbi:MAG TPA: glycogen/starch synthase, partial [Fimbriimonadaceae bacterium]|nr:glycogen/starch synthase [Fimbriimonadaceae bacterium]
STTIYLPGSDQHLFMARGILAAMEEIGWIPDVLHCNDWHTGVLPVVLREDSSERWSGTASVFTIHNLAYQGEFGIEIIERLGLSHGLFNMHQLETFGSFNFLKAGAVYADQVNTVSPQYAQEIQTPEFGCRLEGLMGYLAEQGKLHGILNGIDMGEFDPAKDRHIPAHFSAADPAGKRVCKEEVLKELGLTPEPGVPLMGVVSRLSGQKGMDMMIEKAEDLFALPAQLIVQGLGDAWLAERYRELEARFPNRFRFVEKFDADLAQRIYAGSDIFLMPSAFEPCGLGQMIALRYGTIPVVRRTGGLANTVFEGENGFVFEHKSAEEFLASCRRAVEAYGDPERWNRIVTTALEGDYGWTRSAKEYEAMYERALQALKQPAMRQPLPR